SAIKSGLPMPFTSISAGWIFTLMGLLDDGRPLNQGKSHFVDIYPNPEDGRDAIDYVHLLPSNLQLIYHETIKSINSGLAVLTGMGIRAIVETVCKDKNANEKDLYEKINGLEKQGVLTKKDADILHKLILLCHISPPLRRQDSVAACRRRCRS
ncbi:DUF4145 domain-containing protein, partial [Thiolapillus sp.]|uniref:DUF4145 domain-containing protein n=1 Tax=Thiolapillus sp. TaxID=2017437 RepID=UPI003AF561C9